MAAERLAGVGDVRVWCRPSSLARVRSRLPQATDNLREAVDGAEVIALCTPAGAMPELAAELREALAPQAVVTDAASTKVRVVERLRAILGPRFVGAHPMAGSEASGIEAASPNLFQGALCLVVPSEDAEATRTVESFWEAVGCRTRRLSAQEHDRLAARASHLPHAAASALAFAVSSRCPESLELAAGGFRDTTRVAAGPAAMWAEIFLDNRDCLLAALEEYGEALSLLRGALEAGDRPELEKFLAAAARGRAGVKT